MNPPCALRRGLLLCGTLLPLHVRAQARTIRFVVPNAAGGFTDTLGRLVADAMGSSLGVTAVVDNRPGAAGMIGTRAVAASPADGTTVLVTSQSNHVLAPLVQGGTPFDPQAELLSVGLVARGVGVIVVSKSVAAASLRDLVVQAKQHPGALNYGSSGIGSGNHLGLEMFKATSGVDLVHVPYRGGAPLVQGLMADETQVALLDLGSARAGLKSGHLRALVQTGLHRHPTLPDVPTLREAGFGNFDPSFWVGLAVPRGTSSDIVQRLNQSLNSALDLTSTKARAHANGWELAPGTPQAMAEVVQQDLMRLGAEVRRLKLTP